MAQITGIGWVTSDGPGRGRRTPRLNLSSEAPRPPERGGFLPRPNRNYARMDLYSKTGLAAVASALKDAELDEWTEKREIGVIAETAFGCIHTDAAYFETVIPEGGRLASPNLFAFTLPNTFLGETAILFGLTGESFVVSAPEPAARSSFGTESLRLAAGILESGSAPAMVCGICDAPPPVFMKTSDAFAGGIFLVLEPDGRPSAASPRRTYGSLSFNAEQIPILNGRPVPDLPALAVQALSSFHG